ncbi:MAG: translesion error-prone DNA polymerase V autoproteolytic subunit [Sedimentisphaerales bacterium]|nr:translesion error-prone DNA polymerase V autoproteolytic subunit [Sedimentisphaerales bacterium]
MALKIEITHTPDLSEKHSLLLFEAAVPAGFPSPAADYEQDRLDLNRHLVKNPAATFFVRVTGDSMIGAGIHDGDLLVVDRSLETRDKNIVIAVLDGELTVKRIRLRRDKIILEPENESYLSHEITSENEFEVWGVVTNVIHKL